MRGVALLQELNGISVGFFWVINIWVREQQNYRRRGYKYLSKGYWNNLEELMLDKNKIGDSGCKWLSQT